MSGLAITFLILALVAGLFGFIGVAGISMEIAKIVFFLFLALFLVSLITGRTRQADKAKALPGVRDVL